MPSKWQRMKIETKESRTLKKMRVAKWTAGGKLESNNLT